jgi:hypothetical protein
VGTRTGSYPIRFRAELEAALQRHVVAGGAGGEVLVVYSVPSPELLPERTDAAAIYRLELRVVLTDSGRQVAYVDTTQVVRSDSVLAPAAFLHGFLSVPVPPGVYELKVVLADLNRDAGRIAADDSVVVPDVAGPEVVMSDVVIGRMGGGKIWYSGEDSVAVTARRRFPPGPLQVYYEVIGLRPGMPYRSELEVRKVGGGSVFGWVKRLFGGGGAPVALTLDGVASGAVTRVLQTVDLGDVGNGRYRLTIRVFPTDGAEPIEREVDLTLVGT